MTAVLLMPVGSCSAKLQKKKKELFESDVIESEGGENKTLLESESSSSGSQNTVSHFLV